jgi:hypothetical protein
MLVYVDHSTGRAYTCMLIIRDLIDLLHGISIVQCTGCHITTVDYSTTTKALFFLFLIAFASGTVRYGTVRYGTVRYGTVRYGTAHKHTHTYNNYIIFHDGWVSATV